MVFMFEHLLRLGEVVDTKVARQAARRPWTVSNVSFWVGNREVGWTDGGAPNPEDRHACTHALVEVQPSKTDAAGDKFDPLVCPFPSEGDLLVASQGSIEAAGEGWRFATGTLLWQLLATDPVPRAFATVTPLFRSFAPVPPYVVTQLTQNEFVTTFNLFGRSASPRIPVVLGGKRLGGHCMRVAGCNHAASLNATIVQIANKGRWGAWAFAAARGYDYLRTDRPGMQALTMNMVVALASLPYAQAASPHRAVLDWDAAVQVAVALVCLGVAVTLVVAAVGAGVRAAVIRLTEGGGMGAVKVDEPADTGPRAAPPAAAASTIDGRGSVAQPGGLGCDPPWGGVARASRSLGGAVAADGTADTGPVVVPSAPAASNREWREWVQAERAQALADYHARIMAARVRRRLGPVQRRSRTHR
jgi:hypothetical protein